MKYSQKILIASLIFAAFTSCKSATYEWEDGELQRKAAEEETVTVVITVQ